MEFWDGEALETITSCLVRLLKVDNYNNSSPPLCTEPSEGHRLAVMVAYGLQSDGKETELVPRSPKLEVNLEQSNETLEMDFGLWMLITRRKGRGVSGGSGKPESRETHAFPHVPEDELTKATTARSESFRSPRGGMAKGRGGHVAF